MTGASQDRVRDLLEEAWERPAEERRRFLDRACAGDRTLFDDVTSLLAALERGGSMLEPTRGAESAPHAGARDAASLSGFRFGSYEIDERVGAGGMGVVYRATDRRLDRAVAVKCLPAEVSRSASRRARLEQEARALASLNHPNIAAIYGAEETPRGTLLVLEWVPGRTLAQILAGGSLGVSDAIDIARQITLGLGAAHAVGVVHQDLKPANIHVTPEGAVKLLDFGIAKVLRAREESAEQTPLPTPPEGRTPAAAAETPSAVGAPSAAGAILGTAAYMSPEQARGRRTDRRCDIWAFGCVLFEMLTGSRAFAGETTSDTVAAVLRAEPEWTRLPPATPPALRRLLLRCLDKNPDRRLRDASDARLELDDAMSELAAPPTAAIGVPPSRRGRLTATLLVVAAALAGVVIGARAWNRPASPEPVRYGITTPLTLPLLFDVGASFAIAPDGATLAFVGYGAGEPQCVHVQKIDELQSRRIPTNVAVRNPCFSPDGAWIAYAEVQGSSLRRVRVDTGAIESFNGEKASNGGIAWSDSGYLIVDHEGLRAIPASGDVPAKQLTTLDASRGEELHAQPCSVPGTDVVLFSCARREKGLVRTCVEAVRISTGERRVLADDAWAPSALRADTILYCQGDALLAARFDADAMRTAGRAEKVLGSLPRGSEETPPQRVVLSRSGVLAYLPTMATFAATDLAWVGLDGSVARLYQGSAWIHWVRLSPDGKRVALSIGNSRRELWVRDLQRHSMTRIGPDDERQRSFPVWSRDGERLIVSAWTDDSMRIESLAADGSAPPRVLFEGANTGELAPSDITPDGRSVLLTRFDPAVGTPDLVTIPLEGGAPTPLFPTRAPRGGGRFSPDGSMLFYTALETLPGEIVLQPWPALDARLKVSPTSGRSALWRHDGRAIYYRVRNQLCQVEVDRTAGIVLSPERVLMEFLPETRGDTMDGVQFLWSIPPGPLESGTQFAVILHAETLIDRAIRAAAARGPG